MLLLNERYRAIKWIGQGGFGRTFLGVDEHKPSKPPCVIKQHFYLSQTTDNLEMAITLFEQEAVRLEQLGEHEQIPRLEAHFEQKGYLYTVQEYIDGRNLAEILSEDGQWTEAQIRDLLTGILPVLQFVHENNVVHRDVKPENIIQRRTPRGGQFVLVDFGIALYVTGTTLFKTGLGLGDPRFIAPEQLLGKANFSSDLYGLGLTCLYLLSGIDTDILFSTSEDAWVWKSVFAGLDIQISHELAAVLDGMIIRATSKRFPSAIAILELLNLLPKPQSKRANSSLFSGLVSEAIVEPGVTDAFESLLNDCEQESDELFLEESFDNVIFESESDFEDLIPAKSESDNLSLETNEFVYSPTVKIILPDQVVIPPVEAVKVSDKKWGYKDTTGEIITVKLLDDVRPFSEDISGLARVKFDGRWLYINQKLEVVIETRFLDIGPFSEGLAAVHCDSLKWGFIDKTLKVVIPPQFFYAVGNFHEGLAKVNIGEKWGFIDKKGKIVIPVQFHHIYDFHEGLAKVKIDEKWGFIDEKGKIVIPVQFHHINDFHEGLAAVKIDKKWGFIDETGKIVIPVQFYAVGNFHEELAAVRLDEKWGFINKTGKIVIKPKFFEADDFKNGKAKVGKKGFFGNKYGWIDKRGKFIKK